MQIVNVMKNYSKDMIAYIVERSMPPKNKWIIAKIQKLYGNLNN